MITERLWSNGDVQLFQRVLLPVKGLPVDSLVRGAGPAVLVGAEEGHRGLTPDRAKPDED